MGFLFTMVVIGVPTLGWGCYSVIKLGKDLPIAARKMGHRTGMAYNYLKVILEELRPKEQYLGKLSSLARKSEQQATVFRREFKEQLIEINSTMRENLPEELVKNPFEKFMLRDDEPLELEDGRMMGTDLMEVVYKERKRLHKKRIEKELSNLLK